MLMHMEVKHNFFHNFCLEKLEKDKSEGILQMSSHRYTLALLMIAEEAMIISIAFILVYQGQRTVYLMIMGNSI